MPGPVTGADTCLGVATGVVKRGFEAFAAAPLDDGAEAAMDAAGTAGAAGVEMDEDAATGRRLEGVAVAAVAAGGRLGLAALVCCCCCCCCCCCLGGDECCCGCLGGDECCCGCCCCCFGGDDCGCGSGAEEVPPSASCVPKSGRKNSRAADAAAVAALAAAAAAAAAASVMPAGSSPPSSTGTCHVVCRVSLLKKYRCPDAVVNSRHFCVGSCAPAMDVTAAVVFAFGRSISGSSHVVVLETLW